MAKDSIAAAPEADGFAGPEIEEPTFEPKTEPAYDPSMDPGSERWNPKKYFDAQPLVTIVIPLDQSDLLAGGRPEKISLFPAAINGYRLDFKKGSPIRVPRDFAAMLVLRKLAYPAGEWETQL